MADETDLKPLLPADITGVSIDTTNPRFIAARKAAHEAGLTQAQFSALLAHEARGVKAAHEVAKATKPAASAPVAPARIEGYDKMSFAQRMAAGEARRKARGP